MYKGVPCLRLLVRCLSQQVNVNRCWKKWHCKRFLLCPPSGTCRQWFAIICTSLTLTISLTANSVVKENTPKETSIVERYCQCFIEHINRYTFTKCLYRWFYFTSELSPSCICCCSCFCSKGLGFKPEPWYRVPQLRIFSFYCRMCNTGADIGCGYSILTGKPASTGHWRWLESLL